MSAYLSTFTTDPGLSRTSGEASKDPQARWSRQVAADLVGLADAIAIELGAVLPANLPIDTPGGPHADFLALTQKYYDPVLRTKHTDVGARCIWVLVMAAARCRWC